MPVFTRHLVLVCFGTLLTGGSWAQSDMDPSYFREPVMGRYVLRSIGGVFGLTLDNHGPMGLANFERLSRNGLPQVQDDLSTFYFGYSSTALGITLGPRFTVARLRDDQPADRGWTFHVAVQPRLFYLFFYRDEAIGDTTVEKQYLYTVSQMELAVGGGHFWRVALSRAFYVQGSLLAELGFVGSSNLRVDGTAYYQWAGNNWERTLVEWNDRARGGLYGRVFAAAEAGFRIRRRVDLGVAAQFGTGLMYISGVEVHPLLSSRVYLLNMAFLIRR